jgi:hypothetical protein
VALAPALPLPLVAAELPPGLAGTWSEGGCASDSRVRLVNPLGILEFRTLAGERQVQLALLQDVTPAPDGRSVTAVLESPTEERLFEQQLSFADDRLDGAVRCPMVPASLLLPFGEAVALFQAAGELQPLCAAGTDAACFSHAFARADLTGDGRLTLAELSRVLRGAAFFMGYLAERQAIQPAGPLVAPVAFAGWLGPPLIRPLLEGSDYDADGMLSAAELAQDRAAGPLPLAGAAPLRGARDTLESLRALLGLAQAMAEQRQQGR